MMPPCGTFEYELVVPTTDRFAPARARTVGAHAPLFSRNNLRDGRLVGYAPEVWIQEDQITVVARTRRYATCRAASVGVHRDLAALITEGDTVHLARTCCGGLAFALVRKGALVIGVGALSNLTVLPSLGVRCELASSPVAPTLNAWDAEFPVHVTILGASHRFAEPQRIQLQNYQVQCHHGFESGLPGSDESVMIVQVEDFHAWAAPGSVDTMFRCSYGIGGVAWGRAGSSIGSSRWRRCGWSLSGV
jgi:hypothetical protein